MLWGQQTSTSHAGAILTVSGRGIMQRVRADTLVHGIIGGAIAGLVVTVWFLVVDVTTAGAFHTPALLASAILGEALDGPSLRLVATYTVLHFGVFLTLGAVTAAILRIADASPGLLVGAVFGVGVLNAVHYGGLLVTGVDLLTVLPVPHVVGANFLGGMLMMAYLHRAQAVATPLGLRVLDAHVMLTEGLAVGLVGAVVVAFWFLIVDVVTSTPFYTPAALGSALLLGAGSPLEVQVNAGIVAAYTFVHLTAFGVVGVAFAWAAERITRAPGLWMVALMAFIVVEGLFIGAAGAVSEWVLGTLGWVAVGVGNLLAVGAMGLWLWRAHPTLRDRLGEEAVATQI